MINEAIIENSESRVLLSGKVVIVTGGSSGIGRGIALAAAAHRAKIVLVADVAEMPREGGISTVEMLSKMGCAATFIHTDVTDPTAVETLVEAANEYGGVDAMICNAGIALPNDGPGITIADMTRLVAVNLQGVLTCAQLAAEQMKRRGAGGAIIAISSMGGLRGAATTTGYSTTKGGVCLMVASLADAYGPDQIRVNAVCPGIIDTHLIQSSPAVAASADGMLSRTPLRRIGQPEEIGNAVAWLSSDLASYVTGISLPVDGGITAVL